MTLKMILTGDINLMNVTDPDTPFARVADEFRNADVVFGKVDTEAQPALAGAFNIRSIPTLMIARDGIVVYAEAGALPEPALEELISKARELDMDEVRRQIAEAQADDEADEKAEAK